MTDDRPPSERLLGEPAAALETGVPAHLQVHLQRWLELYAERLKLDLYALRLRISWRLDLLIGIQDPAASLGESALSTSPGTYLNLLQMVLREDEVDPEAAGYLRGVLSLGGSAYTVGPDDRTLTTRVEPTAQEAAAAAMSPQDATSEDLAEAWSAAFGREPNAQNAWSAAIRAVEEVLTPIMWPGPPKRRTHNLQTFVRDLRDHPQFWRFGPAMAEPR